MTNYLTSENPKRNWPKRMGNAKKALLIAAILMMFTCMSVWADVDIKVNNRYVVGKVLVSRTTANDLSAKGSSPMHYLDVSIGATNVKYNASAGSNPTNAYEYSADQITAIITFNGNAKSMTGSVTISGGYIFSAADPSGDTWNGVDQGIGNIPYLCVLIKVSGTGQTTSGTISKWYSGTSYEVVGIIDSRDANLTSAEFTLDEAGQCIHILQVPFSKSNTDYFSGAEVSSTAGETYYYTRYTAMPFSIKYGNKYYTANSVMTTLGKVENDTQEVYSTSFGFSQNAITMSVADVIANSSSLSTKAATMQMTYSYLNTAGNDTSKELRITLSPYPDLGDYYYLLSGADTLTAGKYFKGYLAFTNFDSSYSDVTLENNQSTLTSSSVVTTEQYLNPTFLVTTDHPTALSTASAANKTYVNYLQNGDLSFDVYPYLNGSPSVSEAGDYSMTIKAELTVN